MAASITRGDYDQLKQIESAFKSEADAINQMNSSLSNAIAQLEGGDWVGKAATAAFKEFRGTIEPACRRLQKALVEAAKTTKDVNNDIKKTEEETSNIMNGNDMPTISI
jgi:WXG100 family type VII secretion target